MDIQQQQDPALTHCQFMLNRIHLEKGHSIAWIAKISSVSPRTLHYLMAGKTRCPSTSVFRKILALYCWCFYRPSLVKENSEIPFIKP